MERLTDVEISVVIPIHGNPIYLDKTLQSLEDQNKENFEVIVVLDRTEPWVYQELKNRYIKKRKIRILTSKKHGISEALNLGIAEANSQIIARIDSDDTMAKNRLDSQYRLLMSNSKISIVGSQINFMDAYENFIRKSHYPTSSYAIKAMLPIRNCIAHPSVMMRKSIFDSGTFYDSTYNGAEDYRLWLRTSQRYCIVNMPQALTNYRIWENQITVKNKHGRKVLENAARNAYLAEEGIHLGTLNSWRINNSAKKLDAALTRDVNQNSIKQIILLAVVFVLSPIRITVMALDKVFGIRKV